MNAQERTFGVEVDKIQHLIIILQRLIVVHKNVMLCNKIKVKKHKCQGRGQIIEVEVEKKR